MPISRAGVRNRRGNPPPATAGFTLVELTLVILVIGIVGALVLPRFGGLLDRQQARRTVNVLRGMVRAAARQGGADQAGVPPHL